MRHVVLINPAAGRTDRADAVARMAEAAFSESGQPWELRLTERPGHAAELAAGIAAQGEETILYVCGGDGTLGEAAHGLAGSDCCALAPVPIGSGNDFVKSFGGQERFLDIDAQVRAEAVEIDLLKVGDRYSDNVVNFGFDTVVARTVNEGRSRRGNAGKGYYTLGILKALFTAMRNRFKVYADGELLNANGVALLCTLANGEYVGGSFRCAPRADLQDGLMEICLVKPISRLRFVSLIGLYTKGSTSTTRK